MKRLQFRHHDEVFESRQAALEFFANMVDINRIGHLDESRFAEPMVAKYTDEDGNTQIMLAIGVESGLTPYHIIDSAKMSADILANAKAISDEIDRASDEEEILQGAIEAEAERAVAKEAEIIEQVEGSVTNIVKHTEGLAANVLESYTLENANGTVMGETINIYKDSALVAAQIGYAGASLQQDENGYIMDENGDYVFGYSNRDESTEWLYLIYKNADGVLKLVGIDFEQFVAENEIGNGLVRNGETHVVSIKIDGTSEDFLTVSAEGIKLDGIQAAINAQGSGAEAAAEAMVAEEKERAEAVEAELSAATVAAIEEAEAYADEKDEYLQGQITANKITSTDIDVIPSADGTELKLLVDNVTISKVGNHYGDTIEMPYLWSPIHLVDVTSEFDSSVKSAFRLAGAGDVAIENSGDIIIYKDSSLYDVRLGYMGDTIDPADGHYINEQGAASDSERALNFIYILSDGSYQLSQVAVGDFVKEASFGNGLTVSNSVVSIVKGEASEEYLAVGENSISIVGVNDAIRVAASGAVADSKSYTDTRINDLTSSIDGLSATIDTAVEGMGTTVSEAVGAMNDTLTAATDAMNTTLQNAVNGLDSSLDAEVARATASEGTISSALGAETTRATNREDVIEAAVNTEAARATAAENALDTKIDTAVSTINHSIDDAIAAAEADNVSLSGSVLAKMAADIATAKAEAISDAEDYADGLKDAIDAIKVVDVKYNQDPVHPNYIQLVLADGTTLSDGFDASEFIKDGILESVEIAENPAGQAAGTYIKFIFNTDSAKQPIFLNVDGLIDLYTTDNTPYIKIDNNVITARVDGADGFANTLASTDFAKAEADDAEAAAKAYADTEIASAISGLASVYEPVGTAASSIAALDLANTYEPKGAAASAVDAFSGAMENVVSAIRGEIATASATSSNADAALGIRIDAIESVADRSLQEEDFISCGIVGQIENSSAHTLLRKVNVNGEEKYFVSNDASDILFTPAAGDVTSVNAQLRAYETRIAELEAKVQAIEDIFGPNAAEGGIATIVKGILDAYITGTTNEIKVEKDTANDKLVVGFDDNAIFG